jgi:hypothetical protein
MQLGKALGQTLLLSERHDDLVIVAARGKCTEDRVRIII